MGGEEKGERTCSAIVVIDLNDLSALIDPIDLKALNNSIPLSDQKHNTTLALTANNFLGSKGRGIYCHDLFSFHQHKNIGEIYILFSRVSP